MDLNFKMQAAALNAALDVVSIVPPRPITQEGGSGYLFVVRKADDGSGQDRCYVYSQDNYRQARADFEVTDVEGEGAFIYPAQNIDAFRYAEGDITFRVHSDKESDTHTVKYDFGSGAGGDRSTFDPKLLSTNDAKLREAEPGQEFPVAVLREALSMAKPFLAKTTDPRTEEHHKTVQIFDAETPVARGATSGGGDGSLYASNSIQAFYFECAAFKGRPLAIHGQHLPQLTTFLAKAVSPIRIRSGASMTFAEDSRGHVYGWVHHANKHQIYTYYALTNDGYVLGVPKAQVINQLRYMKTELNPKRDKIMVEFDHAAGTLRFQVVDGSSKAVSMPIETKPIQIVQKDWSANVNIDHFLEVFDGAKADEVELRVAVIPANDKRPKDSVLFRTLDEFWLDEEGTVVGGSGVPEGKEPDGAYRCKVTRFVPSKN